MPRAETYGALAAAAKRKGQTVQAEWARREIAAGRCAQGCGRKLSPKSSRYCAPCLSAVNKHSRAHVAARKDEGRCRCGEKLGDFARCDECRARENRARRS
jgi:hypothetical protein